tara:strand:- start:136 stop:600 length:465 start_codon:yes stop_codon:yes gene_type:complete
MATAVSVQYSVSATPIEEVELADSTNTVKSIHSKVDKSIGGGGTAACGATVDNVAAALAVETTAANQTLNALTGLTLGATIDLLVVKIIEATGTSAPACDCIIMIDGTNEEFKLTKVGDATLLRTNGVNGATVAIKSSAATEVCKIDILVGLEA